MKFRPARPDDAETIRDWRNQPDIAAQMYTDHVITSEEHQRWFAAALRDPARRMWVVEYAGRGVGLTTLYNHHPTHRRCDGAVYIAEPSCRRTGVGALAQFEVVSRAFDELCIDKLVCEALVSNEFGVRGYETLGFSQEGLLRGHVQKGGRRRDVIILGLLREEWEAMQPSLRPRIERIRQRVERQERLLLAGGNGETTLATSVPESVTA